MATIVTHRDIYVDIRKYLINTLACEPKEVIQGYQNNSPLPQNAIVMTILFEKEINTPSNYYDATELKTTVQQSREVTMQIDFYGTQAHSRSQKIAILWRNPYTTNELTFCQPLYAKEPRRLPIVNEQSMYEDRWSLDVLLQYNPEVEHQQDFLGMPTVIFNKI